jgi:hydroxymethylpyrimidine kinase/phosphomethylpyrimidine kinase
MMAKIPCALSIAGSDSGGGAGIQADLKTFAALGVHGMTALTAITAQNTVAVTAVQDIAPEVIRAQIDAVAGDIGVDAAKTGMLHVSEIIEVVVEEIERWGFPVVVDPVMIAKSGAQLLRPEAKEALVERLLPIATVVTPNAMEAEAISGVKIETLEDGRAAAARIADLGPEAVVVKGGHILQGEGKAIDILLYGGEYTLLEAERHETKDTHGTGCSFSSAIAAELAKGSDIPSAVGVAKRFVNTAIKHGLRIGRGHGPLNPMANLWNDAERHVVLENVREAVDLLEGCPEVMPLVAEVQMNVGMALPYATGPGDVAAVEGRIVRTKKGVRASGCPMYGASGHVARTILAVMGFDGEMRAAMNLRFSEETLEACRGLGLAVSFYDRREEPEELKEREGSTTFWGAKKAVERIGRVPDVIYHHGDLGKEPMIVLVGRTAVGVAKRAVEIAQRI